MHAGMRGVQNLTYSSTLGMSASCRKVDIIGYCREFDVIVRVSFVQCEVVTHEDGADKEPKLRACVRKWLYEQSRSAEAAAAETSAKASHEKLALERVRATAESTEQQLAWLQHQHDVLQRTSTALERKLSRIQGSEKRLEEQLQKTEQKCDEAATAREIAERERDELKREAAMWKRKYDSLCASSSEVPSTNEEPPIRRQRVSSLFISASVTAGDSDSHVRFELSCMFVLCVRAKW